MKKVYDIIGIVGIVMIFLTAGMSDSGTLSFSHTVLMAMFSTVLLFVSFYGTNFESVEELSESNEDRAENVTPDYSARIYVNR